MGRWNGILLLKSRIETTRFSICWFVRREQVKSSTHSHQELINRDRDWITHRCCDNILCACTGGMAQLLVWSAKTAVRLSRDGSQRRRSELSCLMEQ
uniref:Uncharacterized protein n=1 Tax=Aegilops tauschii subsp. strangulata TaxID=200361 RepID=A0A453GK07_AEGTS